jgi:hypothetical protein
MVMHKHWLMIGAALVALGCRNKDAAPMPSAKGAEPVPPAPVAAAPAAAAAQGKKDPKHNLAISAPLGGEITVPGAEFETKDAVDLAAAKEDMKDDDRSVLVSDEKLADGWAIRYKDRDDNVSAVVQRTIGGKTFVCTAKKEADESICKDASSPDGKNLIVPFTLAEDSKIITVGKTYVDVMLAEESSPKTPEAAFDHWSGKVKIDSKETFAGGFTMVANGIANGGPYYVGEARMRVGPLDLYCHAYSSESAAQARKAMELCRTLQQP